MTKRERGGSAGSMDAIVISDSEEDAPEVKRPRRKMDGPMAKSPLVEAMDALRARPDDMSCAMDLLSRVRKACTRDIAAWSEVANGPVVLGLSIVSSTYFPVQQCLYAALVRIMSTLRRERRTKDLEKICRGVPLVLRLAIPGGNEADLINPIRMRQQLNQVNDVTKRIASFRVLQCWTRLHGQATEELQHEGWIDLGSTALSFCRDDEALSVTNIRYANVRSLKSDAESAMANVCFEEYDESGQWMRVLLDHKTFLAFEKELCSRPLSCAKARESQPRLADEEKAKKSDASVPVAIVTPPPSQDDAPSSDDYDCLSLFDAEVHRVSLAASRWDATFDALKKEVHRGNAMARLEYDGAAVAQDVQAARMITLPQYQDDGLKEATLLTTELENVAKTAQEYLHEDLDAIAQDKATTTMCSLHLVAVAAPWILCGVAAISSSLGYM
ncbi:hypothetical protein, variant [Saprolegnia diclina VS20]|uniref:Uncharacterized protein n=1 Tax=Saprolegnia diclina (strain VS20) TaxID=1156394 RepID=T0QSM3_SAPDV|nr:hypothetical protein, variant [Saprolegnia diclina VS20]EQC41164.1 hypothetical protein, variant [Saprolegnia diclina VS20]|eukprot:XP_008604878.1 hypothetical protein, variant [Saprolegnia diclina VS20]